MKTVAILSLALFALCGQGQGQTDLTLVEKATGEDVVDVVVGRLIDIFGYDYGFMKRIAYVESEYGLKSDTFADGFLGGIWQLAAPLYNQTIGDIPALSAFKADIANKWNVNWDTTTWSDLLKPLHSGLATRLFIATKGSIPNSLAGQAQFWNRHLNRNDSDLTGRFIEIIEKVENETVPCNAKFDLLVVLDESGSINEKDPLNFDRVLNFTADLFGSFSLENVRMGLITYSSEHKVVFELDDNFNTTDEVRQKVLSVQYAAGGTDTNLGILQAVAMYNRTSPREGIPKIMVLCTDGESNTGVGEIVKAKAAGIESFAVGVGNGYNLPELEEIAYGDPSRVFTLTDFQALAAFFNKLNTETCEAPQSPLLNTTITDTIVKNEKRNYKFEAIPEEGMTFGLTLQTGEVIGYYSYGTTTSKPNSALNDGRLKMSGDKKTFIKNPLTNDTLPWATKADQVVYISLTGAGETNKFTMLAERGNTSGAASIIAPAVLVFAMIARML